MNSIVVFVILLFALVFLGWYCGFIDKSALSLSLPSSSSFSESFVTFQQDVKEGAVIPTKNPIPSYSSTDVKISKVYDNIFFDLKNGNLIEVDSTAYDGKVIDNTGTTISYLYISCRKTAGSPIISYKITDPTKTVAVTESQLPFVNSFKSFVYVTKSSNTDRYVVFYMPWNDSTYIHMIKIDLLNKKNYHIATEVYYGYGDYNSNTILYSTDPKDSDPINIGAKIVPDTDTNNNKFITLPLYDNNYSIYQLCSNLYFDVRNGQVVQYDHSTKSISVHARVKGTILTTDYLDNKTITTTSLSTWILENTTNSKLLLYISNAQKTMIAIIEPDGNGGYQLYNLQRFSKTGVDTGLSDGSSSVSESGSGSGSKSGSKKDTDSMMMDYIKWHYDWTNKGLQDPNSHNFNYSDDYMLKTQIVPPVCPACSTSVGTCVQCSGQTGGTVGANGTSVVGGYPVSNINSTSSSSSTNSSSISETPNNTGDRYDKSNSLGGVVNNTVDSGAGLLYGTGSGATNLLRDTGSGVADFTKDAAKGITKQTEKAVTGTVDLGREIVGGTIGLGKDITKGTVDLGKDIVGGIVGLGKRAEPGYGYGGSGGSGNGDKDSDPSRGGYSNSYAGSGASSVTDKYSYYGAVPNKGGNYVPITSDFSSFGR